MVDTVFAAVRMPSSPFIQVDKFAAIAGGKIYIGKPDTDPTVPANQVQVYWEQEDLSLVAVPQPIMINNAGYPVYQGTVGRFVTQTGCSMAVYNKKDVLQYYFDNLLEYDAAQMWSVIQSPTGWEYVGTDTGTLKDQIRGWVTPWDFVGKPAYATVSAAIQAMFDHALATGKIVNAYGWSGTLDSVVNSGKITILGGTWKGTADWRLTDTTLKGAIINNLRLMHWGGNVRVRDVLFDGAPTASKVGSFVMQGVPVANSTIEITETEFRNGYYGILQQGTGETVIRGVFRNLSFYDMQGDGIELNVVNKHYDYGCQIDGIFLDNINGLNASWGIGIGVAGIGPYGWNQPDANYAKNVAIRNVYASRVRQIVHLEMSRDCTVENIHGDPNQTVSNGTGLTLACVICYGCKRITIDGVYGEPVVTGTTTADSVRIVMCEWGVTAGAPANPCFDMTIRNVHSKTGRFYAGVGAGDGYTNKYTIENIDVYTFSVFGVATILEMANVRCVVFDGLGDDSSGGTTSDGYVTRKKAVLRMINVSAYDENNLEYQIYRRCRYSDITSIGTNISAQMYTNIAGNLGAILTNVTRVFLAPLPNGGRISGDQFPTGKEFLVGDVIKTATKGDFTVLTRGAYIPVDGANFQIRATAAGQTYLEQNLVPNGQQVQATWLYDCPLSAGTRIRILGAGASGAPLDTIITRPPYQVNNNTSNPVRIDIANPIVTATAAALQLYTVPNDPTGSDPTIGNTITFRDALGVIKTSPQP